MRQRPARQNMPKDPTDIPFPKLLLLILFYNSRLLGLTEYSCISHHQVSYEKIVFIRYRDFYPGIASQHLFR